ncbi:MAG: hypothetical protein HAW63_02165 [Bdellovibrionaceae bacterium]|nr:hypothetical protein [Pseudobdellovibrionaceae bacterium]
MYEMQLKHSKGSALLMVIMLTIVAGTVLFYLFMGQDFAYKAQKQLRDKTLYAHFIKDIKRKMSWPDQCYIALKGQYYREGSSNSVVLKNVSYRELSKITTNVQIGSGLSISSIQLKRKPYASLSQGEFVLNNSNKQWARDLNLKLKTKVVQLFIAVKSHLKYSFKPIPIDLFVNIDVANKIHSCYTELSVAYVCENLQNVWNAQKGVCEPYFQCFYNNPNICRLPYKRYSVGGGRYLCEWCNPHF